MNFAAVLHTGTLAAGLAGVVYSCTISAAALVALLAPTPARRRAARAVLAILVRRRRC